MTTARRPHYAWLVCLGGALAIMASMGLGINVFSLYQPEIIALNHFTNAQGSWITTTRSLFNLASLFLVNWLCARLGLRLVMTLGVGLVGLSCVLFAFADSFPLYCFAAALTGTGYCLGGTVPLSLAIGAWFRDRRSMALGLASAGSGVSTVLASPLVPRLIARWGLRNTFLLEGGFIFAVAAAVFALIRRAPQDMGLEPYQSHRPEQPERPVLRAEPKPLGWGGLLSLLLAAFLIGGPGGPGFSHLGVLFTNAGYPPVYVASLLAYSGIAISLGKIICGIVYDRLGSRLGNLYTFGVLLGAMLLCCTAPAGSVVLPYIAITFLGLGIPVTVVTPTTWAADLSRPGDYAGSVRRVNIAYTVGVLAFGPVPGLLADRFGSYTPAYALFGGCLALSFLLIQRTYLKAGVGKRP